MVSSPDSLSSKNASMTPLQRVEHEVEQATSTAAETGSPPSPAAATATATSTATATGSLPPAPPVEVSPPILRRTATLKVMGRMLNLKLRAFYKHENDDKEQSNVMLNTHYLNSNSDGTLPETLELIDEDGDKIEGATFSGVTKDSSLRFENNLYEVVGITPFDVMKPSVGRDGGGGDREKSAKRRVSDALSDSSTDKRPRSAANDNDGVENNDEQLDDDDSNDSNDTQHTNGSTAVAKARKREPPNVTASLPRYIYSGNFECSTGTGDSVRTSNLPCRFYCQTFQGTSFGFQLLHANNRLVIADNGTDNRKPAITDVLVQFNCYKLSMGEPLEHVCRLMKQSLNRGPVHLTFAESPDFTSLVKQTVYDARRDWGFTTSDSK